MILTFYEWLSQQLTRPDGTGAFARYAVKDKLFPRKARHLYLFLLRYEGLPDQRQAVKKAHAEWRQARRNAA